MYQLSSPDLDSGLDRTASIAMTIGGNNFDSFKMEKQHLMKSQVNPFVSKKNDPTNRHNLIRGVTNVKTNCYLIKKLPTIYCIIFVGSFSAVNRNIIIEKIYA